MLIKKSLSIPACLVPVNVSIILGMILFASIHFTAARVPTCYNLVAIHGFVEELVVNDDPEYQVSFL